MRIAISQAINRDEINELVFNGMMKPRQYSPLPMSPQYYEKLSNAYIKYDPDTANKLLDEAGYTKKDAERHPPAQGRQRPRSASSSRAPTQAGTPTRMPALLVSKDLAKIGVKVTYKYVERALYTQHYTANDIEAAWWGGDRTVLPLVPEAIIFRGVQPDRPWCPGWWLLLHRAKPNANAVKPPDGHWICEIWKIWDEEVAVEPDPAKQTAAFKKILDIWATELPMIGLLGEQPAPTIVKNGFKGYPAGMPNDDTTGDEHFCQQRDVLLGRSEQAHGCRLSDRGQVHAGAGHEPSHARPARGDAGQALTELPGSSPEAVHVQLHRATSPDHDPDA